MSKRFFFHLGGEVAYVANGAELGARWAFLHISSTLDRHTVTPTEERGHLVTLGEHGAEAGDWAQASVVAWAKSAEILKRDFQSRSTKTTTQIWAVQ